jgi:hypothetical protein
MNNKEKKLAAFMLLLCAAVAAFVMLINAIIVHVQVRMPTLMLVFYIFLFYVSLPGVIGVTLAYVFNFGKRDFALSLPLLIIHCFAELMAVALFIIENVQGNFNLGFLFIPAIFGITGGGILVNISYPEFKQLRAYNNYYYGRQYAYPPQGYAPNAYAPPQGYAPNAYAQQPQGYAPNAYAQQPQQGYDPNAYAQQPPQEQAVQEQAVQGYAPNAYAQQPPQEQPTQEQPPQTGENAAEATEVVTEEKNTDTE